MRLEGDGAGCSLECFLPPTVLVHYTRTTDAYYPGSRATDVPALKGDVLVSK